MDLWTRLTVGILLVASAACGYRSPAAIEGSPDSSNSVPDDGGLATPGGLDAGTAGDAGTAAGAGTTADAGSADDAGASADAGATADAGTSSDGGNPAPDAGDCTYRREPGLPEIEVQVSTAQSCSALRLAPPGCHVSQTGWQAGQTGLSVQANGDGILPLVWSDSRDPYSTLAVWWLYPALSGSTESSIPLDSYELILPMEHGFAMVREVITPEAYQYFMDFFSDEGSFLRSEPLNGEYYTVVPNGMVISHLAPEPDGLGFTLSIQTNATSVQTTVVVAKIGSMYSERIGVMDQAGNVLALWDDGSYTTLRGRWFASDGAALTSSFPTSLRSGDAPNFEYRQLVDNGIAISSLTPTTPDGLRRDYLAVLKADSTVDASPPAWLAALHLPYTLVAHGKAYAVVDPIKAGFQTTIHVLDGSGAECETLTFMPSALTSIGLDGTVAQQKSDGSGVVWWPGLLQSH